MKRIETDVLIIGTGLAACAAALELSEQGISCKMLTRSSKPEDTATSWAQGGIVFRSDSGSDEEALINDILEAGAGACNPEAVEFLAKEGPDLVQLKLIDQLRVPFDQKESGEFSLTEEAAHSVPRILHLEDQTGEVVEKAYLNQLKELDGVEIHTEMTAVDLITLAHHSRNNQDIYKKPRCLGAYAYNQNADEVVAYLAKETLLATGGSGQLFVHTTNPSGSRGDGLAMAYRTGARIMNLEYVQFHPTTLYQKKSERFLITEAMRGEGGKLVNHGGEEFMKQYDERGSLAPRDIVARGIHHEILRENSDHVLLDISFKPRDWILERFPKIYQACLERGVDITQEPIPVVPAAHYACGGVAVDLEGRTTIANLRAAGEVACSGVHGANRLASTSLLEGLLWGVSSARSISKDLQKMEYAFPEIRDWKMENEKISNDLLLQDWMTIKQTMWNYVGLVRTPKRLDRAYRILQGLSDEVNKFYASSRLTDELIGLRNGILAAQLILYAAQRNPESLGTHYIEKD